MVDDTPIVTPVDISPAGLKVLEEREGCELHAYKDVKGIWTIGVGHTAAAGPPYPIGGMCLTQQEVDNLFRKDLEPCREDINRLVKILPKLTQAQIDALFSLRFNIGGGHFKNSTLLRLLNQGYVNSAGRAILMWNEPPSIRERREGEYVQFLHGEYVARIREQVT